MTYSVHYAESIYKTQVELLQASERAELDAHVKDLERHPLPEATNRVFRVRGASASLQPLFARRTRRFMIYHTIKDDRVVVLGVVPTQLKP